MNCGTGLVVLILVIGGIIGWVTYPMFEDRP